MSLSFEKGTSNKTELIEIELKITNLHHHEL